MSVAGAVRVAGGPFAVLRRLLPDSGFHRRQGLDVQPSHRQSRRRRLERRLAAFARHDGRANRFRPRTAKQLPTAAAALLELSDDERPEVVSKDAVEGAVEHEVGGRVDEQQEVGDLADAAYQVAALVVVAEAEYGRHDCIGRDAYDEDDDDGDQHERHATVSRRYSAADRLMMMKLKIMANGLVAGRRGTHVARRAAQSVDDEAVESGYDEQGNN